MDQTEKNVMNTFILHHNDWDGYVSAWILNKEIDSIFEDKVTGDIFKDAAGPHKIWSFPVKYGDHITKIEELNDRPDALVYILDFSFPSDELFEFAKNRSGLVILLDHHVSARDKYSTYLQELGKGFNIFNRTVEMGLRSYCTYTDLNCRIIFEDGVPGCIMTADYLNGFHLSSGPPAIPTYLAEYVAEHDLYKFDLPHSKSIRSAFRKYQLSLESCEIMNNRLETEFGDVVREGKAIRDYMERLKKSAIRRAEEVTMNGLTGLMTANVPNQASDIAHQLAVDSKDGLGVCWYKERGKDRVWHYELRSDGRLNVSKIAKLYGGGGHVRAAGFTSERPPTSFIPKQK